MAAMGSFIFVSVVVALFLILAYHLRKRRQMEGTDHPYGM
jgi:hypothetical protein